ncbi:hypothetical protein ETTORE_0355 [Pseudomonas phage Ettore]|nr:hypothetical protein Deiofobo_0350 [Pseudomonas phage Deifobo]WPK40064.1 hypothetical protein ETTORE_0355 [Pseudomonas phage Ettore]BDR25570.1 hypothetical protein RVBP16_0100 [Pseudomonas phage sp. 30-2]
MKKLSMCDFAKWKANYYSTNKSGQPLRLGQAFINEFSEQGDMPQPNLYYEEDNATAELIILEKYIMY